MVVADSPPAQDLCPAPSQVAHDSSSWPDDLRVVPVKTIPFALLHLACLGVVWVGWSPSAVTVCVAGYLVRMFAITAGYHRYFSHRTFKTSRWMQFLFAWLGASAAQLGPLWWAAHHRDHHLHADTDKDVHPPGLRGFIWSHMGWFFCRRYSVTRYERVRDWTSYPELGWIERNWLLPPALWAAACWLLGSGLQRWAPSLGTSGPQMLVWGFVISTVVLYHITFCINSLAHVWGDQPYPTRDDSRNNLLLALLTLGEGWHNNHHQYPSSERQGFLWWEIDMTHYLLQALSWVGLVWELRGPPASHLERRRGGQSCC